MNRIDELIGAYYSPEIEALRKKASKSYKASVITAIVAVAAFSSVILSIFLSLAFELNLFSSPAYLLFLLISIPTFIIFIPVSWFFSVKYMLSCKKVKDEIDRHMKTAIQSEQGAAANP